MANKVLIVDDEIEIAELLGSIIDGQVKDLELFCTYNGLEAVEKLKEHKESIKLIISDYNMPEMNGGELFHWCKENCPDIPFLMISARELSTMKDCESLLESKNNSFLIKPVDFEALEAYLGKIFDSKKESSEYIGVSLKLFKNYQEIFGEGHLKLNDEKFIKIVTPSKEKESAEQIDHFISKGIKKIYIKEDRLKDAFLAIAKQFSQTLESVKTNTEVFEMSELLFEVNLTHVRTLGVSQVIFTKTKESIAKIVKGIDKGSQAFKLLQSQAARKDYLFGHSLLTLFLSNAILELLPWKSQQTIEQISLACFYHDIFIQEESLAKVDQLGLNTESLSNDELEKIQSHMLKGAELLEKLSNHFEPKNIVMDHHEKPDGSGFPRGLNANQITPLTCIFILSHRVVERAFELNFEQGRLLEFVATMSKEGFNKGNFKRPYKALLTHLNIA